MADIVKIGSGVPRVPLRRVDDLVGRIEALVADANAQGYGTLAYFLETALIEARIQMDREAEERRSRDVNPRELWLPKR
ncbi:hypothetical protein [Bosea sp. (in: a-proteobacteria)]|jgi:hypothetical protein|uniref:hypothetical protein n=1 Tax=Bosea sp. (in: a-proteobacteria) TaxID=1871050 RepID=UPI002DDCCA29|nr:hypothetical protein [Bosea sp. (in: a-proteobacteria)]HEV2508648.1 hypothetical protein [Bosea sp. (in: a-proteobacteria)]